MPVKNQLSKDDFKQVLIGLGFFVLISSLLGCSLSEEIKQIKASKEYEEKQQASRSSDLTGEQIFVRSCYTCHSGNRDAYAPSLKNIGQKYNDEALKDIIRKGKGIMPAQPASVLNDDELNHLIDYLKTLQ